MRASLRFLLFYILPYLAICLWILLSDSIELSSGKRCLAVVLFCIVWLSIVLGSIPDDGKVHRRGPVRPPEDS